MIQTFYWHYEFNPEPGPRQWYKIGLRRWVELYLTSGHRSSFNVVADRFVKDNVQGSLVLKVDGGYERTGVRDGAMQVFIPDREGKDRGLYFRHRSNNGGWQDWKYAAKITYIHKLP